MKIVLSGYGRMGKAVEEVAQERGHIILLKIDSPEDWDNARHALTGADVVIDFTMPAMAVDNIYRCFDLHIPLVIGTTGWYNRLEEVRTKAQTSAQSLFYASNFSLGANILFALNRKLAETMNRFPEFDVSIKETHHIHKLDSPSGTAIILANDIIAHNQRKKKWVNHTQNNPQELLIQSVREGEVFGTHEVTYTSEIESISIIHEARSRRGLATGAVIAAEWLQGKTGVFTMDDIIG